jgi:hypothetical protein
MKTIRQLAEKFEFSNLTLESLSPNQTKFTTLIAWLGKNTLVGVFLLKLTLGAEFRRNYLTKIIKNVII